MKLKYFSDDFQDEVVKLKNAPLILVASFITSIIYQAYHPDSRAWICAVVAIVGLGRYAISGGKEQVKIGEYINLKENTFEFFIVKSGYRITVPYEEIIKASKPIFPMKRIRISLSGNRVVTLSNFSKSEEILNALTSKASI